MPRPLLAFAVSFGILLGAPWLRAQSTFGSIVGSANEPLRPAFVAILLAARYVNASRDARGRDQFRK